MDTARLARLGLAGLIAAIGIVSALGAVPAGAASPPSRVVFDVGDGARVGGEWFAGPAETLVVVIAPRLPARDPGRAVAAEAFRAAGFSVLTFDYRDVDSRTGVLPDSLRFVVYASRWVDDMVGALRFARQKAGSRGHVFAWGQGIGSNVAIAAAGRGPDLADAVVVEGLFRNIGEHLDLLGTGVMPEIVQQHRRLVFDRDQPASAMNRYHGPMFVVMAGRDSVMPILTTKDVYRGRRARTDIYSLPQAGHEDAASDPGYFRTVTNWLKQWRFTRPR